MSALWAPITGRREENRTFRRPLRAVAEPAPRLARFPYLLVLIGIFGIGMAGLLMLNTTLQGPVEAIDHNLKALRVSVVEAIPVYGPNRLRVRLAPNVG